MEQCDSCRVVLRENSSLGLQIKFVDTLRFRLTSEITDFTREHLRVPLRLAVIEETGSVLREVQTEASQLAI
jgi:hypothetical protein